MPGITIVGSGSFAPGEPVTNHQLARVMDTNDAWIRQRTGIAQRHFADEGMGSSFIGARAAERAIEDAGMAPEDIDYIVMGTMTPDYVFPGTGGLVGASLGIPGVPAIDIRQQCAAFPFSVQVADGLIAVGAAETILIIGAEAHAGFMPWDDWDVLRGESDRAVSPAAFDRATRHRGLACIFGDGGGALVMRRSEQPGHGLIGVEIHTDGRLFEQIYIPGGGFRRRPYWSPQMFDDEEHIPRMAGRELFKAAVTRLPQVVRSLCRKHAVEIEEIDWFVAHQANDRINEAIRKALRVPKDKVPSNIARYGNTSGGTIPILMDELLREGRIERGQLICFLAAGAGLNWGAALMRY